MGLQNYMWKCYTYGTGFDAPRTDRRHEDWSCASSQVRSSLASRTDEQPAILKRFRHLTLKHCQDSAQRPGAPDRRLAAHLELTEPHRARADGKQASRGQSFLG